MTRSRQVFISGGGPSGLAAALLFHQLGWEDIVLVEQRSSPQDFEKNKAFNYLVDGRGQKLLRKLGIRDRLFDYGVETKSFTATSIGPDGETKVITPPIIDPNRPTAFWTTRRNLLTLLHDRLCEIDDGRITLLYDHKVEQIDESGDRPQIVITDRQGGEQRVAPDLLLACDGLISSVRKSLERRPALPSGHFDMVEHNSISAGLTYKVLNLPASFTTKDGSTSVADHRMSYIISSRHKDRRKACSLFAFPVADPSHPRSVNIIREADHLLWKIDTGEGVIDFLEDAFPQLDIHTLVTREEAEDFALLRPGRFPVPQYASHLHALIGSKSNPVHCLLIGDAAHAFPPDLGMGVNSALEDLLWLSECLENGEGLAEACTQFEKRRLPENRALVKLVQTVFPEQYFHKPLRAAIWMVGFFVRRALNPLVPWLVGKPAFHLTQNPELTFTQILADKQRTDLVVRLLSLALVCAALWSLYVTLSALV